MGIFKNAKRKPACPRTPPAPFSSPPLKVRLKEWFFRVDYRNGFKGVIF
jgi:hypothetical protein